MAGKKEFEYYDTINEAEAAAEFCKPSKCTVIVSQFAEEAAENKLDQSFFDFDAWQQDGAIVKYANVRCPGVKGMGEFKVKLSKDVAKRSGMPSFSSGQLKDMKQADAHKSIGQVCAWAKQNGVRLVISVDDVSFGWYPQFKRDERLVVVNKLVLSVKEDTE
jgi:hypothetical protein